MISTRLSRGGRSELQSGFWVLLALCTSSCASAPETAPLPVGRKAEAPSAPSSSAAGAAIRPGSGGAQEPEPLPQREPLFSLTPAAGREARSEDTADPKDIFSPASARSLEESAVSTGPSTRVEQTIESLPPEGLQAELRRRYSRKWLSLLEAAENGGIGEIDAQLDEAAVGLLALNLMSGGAGADERTLSQVVAYAISPERDLGQRLLAAAYLDRTGKAAHAREVLQSISAELAPEGGAKEGSSLPGDFEVSGVALAESIAGPAQFTPAPEESVAPGNLLLIYGEFHNFATWGQEEPQEARDGQEGPDSRLPLYRRAFQASLRLLAAGGKEIDQLEFLPESRGRQSVSAPGGMVNFWARYRLPATLEPGAYTLVVEARDILGGGSASGELVLEIKENP